MAFAHFARGVGNELYKVAFPIYRPLYSIFKRFADRTERDLLKRNLSFDSIVVDAGANIGVYSQFFSACVGPAGMVHGFEPEPSNFSRLHAALSGLPNVRLNRVALSDETRESALYVSDRLNVDHRAYPTAGDDRRTISIQSIRLDDYFQPRERVDVIKMDIQGFELRALRGAGRVLMDNPNAKILLEFWPYGLRAAGDSAEALLGFLRERALLAYRIEGSGLARLEDRTWNENDPDDYFNLFVRA